MKIKIPHIEKNEQIFFVAYLIFLVFSILSTSFYYKYFIEIYKYIIAFSCMLLIIQEIKSLKLKKDSFIGLLLCITLFIITITGSQGAIQNSVSAMFLFMYCARKVSFEKIAKITLIVSVVLLIFIIMSGYLGIIDNYLYVKSGRYRWCLGFRYTLDGPTIFFNIVALCIYIKKNTMKIWQICILFLINYWFYIQTDSRSTAALTALMLCYLLYLKFRKREKNEENRFFALIIPSYIVFLLISLYMTVCYDPSKIWMAEINKVLNGRLRLGQNAIIEYGVHLFSQNISMVGNGLNAYGQISTKAYTYVDSLYIQLLVHYGIIFMILYLFVMTLVLIRCYKTREYLLMIILLFIGAHCLIDDLQLYLYLNTFWIAIGQILMKTSLEEKVSLDDCGI